MMENTPQKQFLLPIILSLLTLYIVWGSTYLGIHVLIEKCPPIIASGGRNLIAGAILIGFALVQGKFSAINKRQFIILGLSGIMMLTAGNALLTIAAAWVPTGYMSLFPAMVPGIIVIIEYFYGKKPNFITIIGLILGFIGLYFLVTEKQLITPSNSENFNLGVIFLILASLGWSFGVMISVKNPTGLSIVQASGIQMIVGGLASTTVGLIMGEGSKFDISQFETNTWLSLGYLIIFGSIVGFLVFNWVSLRASPTLVSTYSYVNPLVAILLGVVFLNETFSTNMAISTAIIVLAVFLITYGTKAPKKSSINE